MYCLPCTRPVHESNPFLNDSSYNGSHVTKSPEPAWLDIMNGEPDSHEVSIASVLVTCPICEQIYNTKERAPVYWLSKDPKCYHTFCLVCVTNWISYTGYVCPICLISEPESPDASVQYNAILFRIAGQINPREAKEGSLVTKDQIAQLRATFKDIQSFLAELKKRKLTEERVTQVTGKPPTPSPTLRSPTPSSRMGRPSTPSSIDRSPRAENHYQTLSGCRRTPSLDRGGSMRRHPSDIYLSDMGDELQEEEPTYHVSKILNNKFSDKSPKFYMTFQTNIREFGRIVIETFPDLAPRMAENFGTFCSSKEPSFCYRNSMIFQVSPGEMIRGGDVQLNSGEGGYSIYDRKKFIADESPLEPRPGAVVMARWCTDKATKRDMVGSQFIIRLNVCGGDRGRILGYVVSGLEVVDAVSRTTTQPRLGPPVKKLIVADCGVVSG